MNLQTYSAFTLWVMQKRLFLLCCFLFPLSVLAQTGNTDPFAKDRELIRKADLARMYGNDTTKVYINEFADFACPDCKWFYETRLDSLKNQFIKTGKANFIFRAYVIPRLMRGFHGAEAAYCAGGIAGRAGFEGMMGKLFNQQADWRRLQNPLPKMEEYARSLKIPLLAFKDCMARDVMAPLIITDIRLANAVDIPGTPTMVLTIYGDFSGEEQLDPDVSFSKMEAAIRRVETKIPKK